jgi:hypothetical protein
MKIIEILDSPIAFHRCLAEITGSANAGLLLSQAIYWQNRPSREDADGWWYKTREDWYKETSLSRKELETARRACSGILIHKKKGIPPKTYYKVNVEELERRLLELPGRSVPIIRTETGRMNGPKGAVCADRNGPSIYTETNTETTPETNLREGTRFAPPSLEEVKVQGVKIGMPVDECEKFHAYHEARGWMMGRAKMKSWPHAMILWRKKWQEYARERPLKSTGKSYKTSLDIAKSTIENFDHETLD